MKALRAKHLPVWAFGLLLAAVVLRLVTGAVFLERTVRFDIDASDAGERWSLRWLNGRGEEVNGVWLDVPVAADGSVAAEVVQPVPNYGFPRLELRWEKMPGAVLKDGDATLHERVIWMKFSSVLHRAAVPVEGTQHKDGAWKSSADRGGVAWSMPSFTPAQVLDVLCVWLVLACGFGVLWIAYAMGDPSRWYRPEVAALAIVVVVHVWLAWRAPLVYCPDSMDYAVGATSLVQTHSFSVFTAWRPPGYALFLTPFVACFERFNPFVGWVQAVLGVATAVLAARTARAYMPPAFAPLTLLLVGLNPMLLSWEKHAMPESLAAFLAMSAVWVVSRGGFWAGARMSRAVLAAVGLGVLLACAAYVRGNLQVLVLCLPLVVGFWSASRAQWKRGVLLGGVTFLCAVVCLMPWVLRNKSQYGRAELVIGTGFTRVVSLSEAGALDEDQTAVYGWDVFRAIKQEGRRGYSPVMRSLRTTTGTPLAESTKGVAEWPALDDRAKFAAAESVARHPRGRWEMNARAMVSLLGLWPLRDPGFQENEFWSRSLVGPAGNGTNHENLPEAYKHIKLEMAQDIYNRTVADMTHWSRSDDAGVFKQMFVLCMGARPLWAGLALLGILGAVARRQWFLVMIGGACVLHAAALAMLLYTGIDRYQAPLYPVMTVLACYGLACVVNAVRGEGSRAS